MRYDFHQIYFISGIHANMAPSANKVIRALQRTLVAGVSVFVVLLAIFGLASVVFMPEGWLWAGIFVILWAGLTVLWLRNTGDAEDRLWGGGPQDYSIGPHTEYGDLVQVEQEQALSELSDEE